MPDAEAAPTVGQEAPPRPSIAFPYPPPERSAEEALEDALDRLMALTGAHAGAVAVPSDDGPHVVAERRLGDAAPVSRTVLRRILEDAETTVAIADPPPSESVQDARIVSVLHVPIRHQGRTLAGVYLDRRGVETFDPGVVDLAAAFSSGVALALSMAERVARVAAAYELTRREVAEARAAMGSLRSRWSFGSVATRNAAFADRLRFVEKIAASDTTLLLQGETGTGKEHLARAVHQASPRGQGPFVVVNCAAIPETLIESELFGVERRVASGVDPRPGLVELASGGTLFLDEIGELPLQLQPKLLRAVEGREVRRVGGERGIPVDVRVLVATNRDLRREVVDGRFREDLFYRIATATVTLPPLRNRREDIPYLAEAFLEEACRERGRRRTLHADALGLIMAHAWPGNVRELLRVMEVLAVIVDGDVVTGRDVARLLSESSPPQAGEEPGSYRERMDSAARRTIQMALDRTGSISGAARLLGLTRQTVSLKCRQLGIDVPK